MSKIRGFTLLETVVTIGILAFILPTFFVIILNIARQQTKLLAVKEAKSQGDTLFNIVTTLIRNNAVTIHDGTSPIPGNQICATVTSPAINSNYFKDRRNNWFRIYLNGTTIASQSASTSVNLTDSKVRVTSFTLTCSNKSAFSTPIVSISYQIEYNTSSTRSEDIAHLQYQSKIKLRNP